MARTTEQDVSLSKDDIPEWDVGDFHVPEASGYHHILVVRESGITTRRAGGAYSGQPEDIHYGRIPTIRIPDNCPGHIVQQWVVDHLSELESLLVAYQEAQDTPPHEVTDDPRGRTLRLADDLAQAQGGEFVTDDPSTIDPDRICDTVEDAEAAISEAEQAGCYYVGDAEDLLEWSRE